MAEAVFNISADITPQIDERELQRQAELLARQLNGILAKQIDKVDIRPVGNFRPFEKEVNKSLNVLDRFKGSLNTIPRVIANVGRAGRTNFLKFTDAINLTRREMVGFGGSIVETIKRTNLFEDALENVRSVGGTIADLPQNFEELAAQIRSGTSVIDRMAESGSSLAQLFQPLQQQGEAARTELVDISGSLNQLTRVITQFAAASGRGIDVTRDDFDLLATDLNNLEKPFFRVQSILNDAGLSTTEFGKHLRATFAGAAGDPEQLVKALVALRNETQKTAGPMGFLAQILGQVTKEERAAAKAARLELNASLIELGQGAQVQGIQELAARFALLRQRVSDAVQGFNEFRQILANILPGRSPIGPLVDSIADSVTFFKVLRAEGVGTLDAILGAAKAAFQQFKDASGLTTFQTNFSAAMQRVKSELAGLGLLIAQTNIGQKLNQSLGQVGNFLSTNLTQPLKAGLNTLRSEFARLGGDIANGLKTGFQSASSSVVTSAQNFGRSFLNALRRVFKTGSPSKETEAIAGDVVSGFTRGISQGLGAITSSAAAFAKSFTTVLGVSLAGLGAVALNTGKDFNVLKQVINASLPVIVGSEKAAAGLLEQVNALNDASPFARSTFLELTRVLAGFGVQVEKITPLIDAIQQTVAATGGSDQDILELGNAFARLQSQGRVSLEVLQSFTTRGVDAVAILAEGFGKTTSEMRKMISDGLVPANKAVDILTKGLKERFDGATDAVARNFPGALQRVQARLRDIGGTLLTAFITPTGGGALVDFLNNMADLLSHINKKLLPAFAPLLQKVADALVVVSEKAELFVKRISGEAVSNFIKDLEPLLPLLAALAGLIPAAFGFIPVVGPLIAGLGGPFTALAAAITVFLAQSGQLGTVFTSIKDGASQMSDTVSSSLGFLKDNISGVAVTALGGLGATAKFVTGLTGGLASIVKVVPVVGRVGEVISGLGKVAAFILNKFQSLFNVVGKLIPTFAKGAPGVAQLGGALKALSGPVGIVIGIIAQLVLTSQRFRESLGNLFESIKPVAGFLVGVFAVAIKIVDEAVKALEPAFTLAVNILATFFNVLGSVLGPLKAFIAKIQETKVIEKVFAGIKEGVELAVGVVVKAINILIKAYNKLPFLDDIPEIKFNVDEDPMKKAAKEAEKNFKELQKAGEESANALQDNYAAATKAVENATKAVSDAKDQLLQAIQSAKGVIDGLISSARNVEAANAAIQSAREKSAQATANVTLIEQEYAKALEDTISPAKELGVAERELTRIRKGLTDLDRESLRIAEENKKIQQEIADLQGEKAADDRAALARSEERATIALNRARQAEIDLLNELNGVEKVSVDLSGLSLDQIRAKLAAIRASSKAQKGERDKTPQEIADEKRSARLDVEDAEQAKKDATSAKAQFEIDNQTKINDLKTQIRDNDERIREIADDREDQLLQEEEALKRINKLRLGETSQQQVILDFDQKIRDAKKEAETAAKGIETATKGAQIAQAQFKLDTATAKGDAQGILTAQDSLWKLQAGDLLTSNRAIRDVIGEQKKNIEGARDAAREMNAELERAVKIQSGAASLQAFGTALQNVETLGQRLNEQAALGRDPSQAQIRAITKADAALAPALRAALASGIATDKAGNPVPFSPRQIDQIISEALSKPTSELRKTLQDIFKRLGVTLPGFATGYAPGEVHQGLNNGKGLVRMFEYGREAVLPLTRSFDMARVVRNPYVLPKILDALPRWSMPENRGLASELTSSVAPSDLSEAVRSARRSSGPANSDVYEKKSQREFAGTIGEAVKTAVKEALSESDNLGADVDINVGMNATDTQRQIAREVKRQVEKALGKW